MLIPPRRPPKMPTFRLEEHLSREGHVYIAGIDEVGRGAWAGPVCAAAVILPRDRRSRLTLAGVDDSKQLTPEQRAVLRRRIEEVAVAWAVGSASSSEIDALGIVPATRLAMTRAASRLCPTPDVLLIDAVALPALHVRQHAFNFADAISLSVAAASILAKTARDDMMCALDEAVPGYGFAAHKGYGTHAHALGLRQLGPCWAHRRSFAPVAHCQIQDLTNSAPLDEDHQRTTDIRQ
jgi:ribonuclease HII